MKRLLAFLLVVLAVAGCSYPDPTWHPAIVIDEAWGPRTAEIVAGVNRWNTACVGLGLEMNIEASEQIFDEISNETVRDTVFIVPARLCPCDTLVSYWCGISGRHGHGMLREGGGGVWWKSFDIRIECIDETEESLEGYAMHETGHALELPDNSSPPSVMTVGVSTGANGVPTSRDLDDLERTWPGLECRRR